MPRYELVEGSSNKFWEIVLSGASFATSWGKIGGSTSSRSRDFASAAAATKEHDKLVAEKVGKGYTLVGGKRAASAKPAAAKPASVKPAAAKPAGAKPAAKGASKAKETTGPTTNPDLERAIIADPDDTDAYLVYADWLQAQGDPRGELGVLQHRAASGKAAANKDAGKAAKALIKKHGAHFLGEFAKTKPPIFELEWHCGFIKSALIGWEAFAENMDSGDDDDDDDGDAADVDWDKQTRRLLATFLRLPSARFIQKLVLGPIPSDGDMTLDGLAKAIDDVVPPCLRSLDLGNTGDWDISSTSTAKPNSKSIQGLRSLVLYGGSLGIGEIDLPELRSASFQTGAFRKSDLKKIFGAKWPKLERLEIWFGEPRYGADCTIKSIAPILAAEGLAKVRHLGLRNCAFADEIARALPKSKVLQQLESLDLSMGNLSDRGVEAMAASKDAFKHLALLDVSDNALTDAAKPLVKNLATKVEFGKRHSVARALPRTEETAYYRFVSVGE